MRSNLAAVATLVTLAFAPATMLAQGGNQTLTIVNYQLIVEERVSVNESNFTYRAEIVNTGAPRSAVTATLTSLAPSVRVVGNPNIHFLMVTPNGRVPSIDTFTILVDRTVPFDFASLQWSFDAPFANAGPDISATVGETVTLNAGNSSNPSGLGTLSYNWTILSRPPGTSTRLTNATSVISQMLVDVPGDYVIQVTVSNGFGSDTDTVVVSTSNIRPVANAGPNQTVPVGALVTLNGSGSSDANGDPITFLWTFVSRPAGSNATLNNPSSVTPTFTADRPGTYVVQLVVNDGKSNSDPATVTINTQNTPPVANAGPAQTVNVGSVVQLNGSGSTDADGDLLTYQWQLTTRPNDSNAALSNPTAVNPTFVADRPGTYVAQLVVNDGRASSLPSTVTITTNALQPPVANAGPNQTARRFVPVNLAGSGTDPQGLPLTFTWSFTTRPPNSNATLSATNIPNPTFTPDQPGTYVLQLIVRNGFLNSLPSTVTITTTNTPPVANAGPDQTVGLASIVTLNGSASSDADQDPLTFSWSFLSRPEGSAAVLSAPTSATPTFLADQAGTFVVQLIVNDGITVSVPDTVTITVISNSIILSPAELTLFRAPGTLRVAIPGQAGPGGQQVNLAVLDPTVATVPPSVVIPEGASHVNVVVTPGVNGSTILAASAPGLRTTTANIIVTTPTIAISLSSGTVGLSRTVNGTVTLNAPAPPGGTIVNLSVNPPGLVTFQPAAVTIPEGATTGNFVITGVAEGSGLIVGTSAGYTTGTAPINVGRLGVITLQQGVVVALNGSTTIQVSLAVGAPVGGVTIDLVSSDPTRVTITPAQVFINQGETTPAVQPQVTGVAIGTANITASAPGFTGDTKTVTVSSGLVFNPNAVSVGAGGNTQVTLALASGVAPNGGLTINLNSSNPQVANVPPNVVIPQGANSVTVTLTGVANGTATINANPTIPGITPATLTVTVSSTGVIQAPANISVPLGGSAALPVTLTNAPSQALTVNFTVTDPTRVSMNPASVNIAAGATAPVTQAQVNGLAPGTTTVTASATNYGPATVNVQVTASFSFAPQNLSLTIAEVKNLVLTLSGPAPAGGLIANLASNNTAVATVPFTVTIPAGSTTVNVPVTGVSLGAAVISATANGVTAAQANVSVQGTGAIQVPANLTVSPGGGAQFTITLPTPAPNNLTVSVASSDTTKVTISPAAVLINAGQTQPAFQPSVTGQNFGSATITASAPGYLNGTGTVTVAGALSFSQQNVTLNEPIVNVILNLNGAAPAGGLVVALNSSNTAVATVPATVTIPEGSASRTIQVSAVAPGVAVITASAPNVTSATLNVTVPGAGGGGGAINLPTGVTVGVGQSAPFAVTLSIPAPAGGVTVNLSSSDVTRLTIAPLTVFIPAGATTPANQPQVTGVTPGTANINATAPNYTPASRPVTVTNGAGNMTLTPASLNVAPGAIRNLTVTISTNAGPGGAVVNLASSNTAIATVPASVTVPQGSNTVTIPVTGVAVGSATITATSATFGQATATVNVQVAADIILPENVVVAPGDFTTFSVRLANPAAQGTFITLTISDPSRASLSQTSIFINAGQTLPAIQPRLNGIANGTVTITATAVGLAPASVTVRIGFAISFQPNTLTIIGTATQNLTLVLSGPAPQGGLPVNLSSSNTAVATVPASVTFGTNTTTINVAVTGVAPGTVTIRAQVNGMEDALATVTVQAPGTINLPPNPVAQLSTPFTFPISLTTPAPPAGTTVTLTVSNPDISDINPKVINIAPGQTQPAVQPVFDPINVGSVTVTATAPGYTQASTTVTIGTTVFWLENNVVIPLGTRRSVFLRMSTMAPWPPGTTVTLTSSNPSIARVQASVDFITDGSDFTAINIPIHGEGPGTATITAQGLNIPPAVLTVIVPGPLTFNTTSLPAGSVGAPYSFTLQAGGGTPPLAWQLLSGTLPAGLSFNTTTGTISGTPTAQANNVQLQFRVTDSGNPQESATRTLSLTIGPQVPASIEVSSGTPQSAVINTQFANPLAALVRDASGNPVPGVTVTFTAPGTGASGTFAGGVNTAVTNAQGIATSAAFTANGIVGSYQVLATVASISGNAAFSLTNNSPGAIQVPATTSVNLSQSTAFNVSIPVPAPAGGVTVALVSSNTNIVVISSPTVFIPAGQTQPAAQPQVTGIALGSATITASAPGFTNGSGTVQVTANISFSPSTLTMAPGQTQNLTLTLSANAPTGGLTFNVSSSNTGVATVPATVNIPAGQNVASVPVTAVAAGTTTVTASNGLPSTTATVNVVSVLTITTTSLPNGRVGTNYSQTIVATGGTQPYNWQQTGGTLPAGLSFNAQTGTISGIPTATATAVQLNFRVTDASNPQQVANVTLFLTITAPTPTAVTVVSGSLQSTRVNTQFPSRLVALVRDDQGQPLGGINVTFSAPAFSGIATATFEGGVSTVVAVSDATGAATSPFLTANNKTGSYNVTASVVGVTQPANFTLANTAGPAASITPVGGTPQVAALEEPYQIPLVAVVRDIDGNPLGANRLVTFTIVPGPTGASATFAGNLTTVEADTDAFGRATPGRVLTANDKLGNFTVLATTPGVINDPAVFNLTNVLVAPPPPTLTLTGASVGKDLQTALTLTVSATTDVVLTSSDPTKLLVSERPNLPGAGAVIIPGVPGGVPTLVTVQALADSGTVTVRADALGLVATATITLTPSGFRISGPNGVGQNFTTAQGNVTPLNIIASRLNSSLQFQETQAIRTGLTVQVPLNQIPQVGTLANQVTFTGPQTDVTTNFTALVGGSAATISVGTPPGFSTPANGTSLVATVTQARLTAPNVTVGKDLQTTAQITLDSPSPANLSITIQSNDPTKVRFARNANEPGEASITLVLTDPGRIVTPPFFVHGLDSTGSVNYTATAPGYSSATGTVNLRPSGFAIESPLGNFPTTPGQPNTTISIASYMLNPDTTLAEPQNLRGGIPPVSVNVTSSNTTVGVIIGSPVIFQPATGVGTAEFDPLAAGTAQITVNAPPGFSLTNRSTVTATVSNPNLIIQLSSSTLGDKLQRPNSIILTELAPPGGLSIQVTSANPALLAFSTSPTVPGTASITILVPAGQNVANFFMEGRGSAGTVTFTVTPPAPYPVRTGNVELRPSGFVIQPQQGGFPLTVSQAGPPVEISIVSAMLDPATLAFDQALPLAAGQTVSVAVTNSNPSVGSMATPIVINGGESSASGLFTPVPMQIGNTDLSITQQAGFSLPSNLTSLRIQVR